MKKDWSLYQPPSRGSCIRSWMRLHDRVASEPVKIRNPAKYLHAHARRRSNEARSTSA
jgi:hypothetical protein